MKLTKKEIKGRQAYFARIKRKRKQIDKRQKRCRPTISQLMSAQAKAEGLSYGKFMAKLYIEAVKLDLNEHQYFMRYYIHKINISEIISNSNASSIGTEIPTSQSRVKKQAVNSNYSGESITWKSEKQVTYFRLQQQRNHNYK